MARPNPVRAEQIRKAVTPFHFFPVRGVELLDEYHFPEVKEIAARIIEKAREMDFGARDAKTKEQLQGIIYFTSSIVKDLSKIAQQKMTNQEDDYGVHIDTDTFANAFNNMREILLILPENIDADNNPGSTSYQIAGICFYLLVLSAAITVGATFGAWYFGYLTTSFFTNMVVSSLAYFDIPTTIMGLVAYAVYASKPEPSTGLNSLAEDITLLFDSCKTMINELEAPAAAAENDL